MKKFLSILLTTVLYGFAVEAQAQATLSLKVKGLAEGTQLDIKYAGTCNSNEPAIQTVTVQKGKAKFTLDADDPRGYSVAAPGTYGGVVVALAKGENATLTAEASVQGNNTNFKNVVVKGSPTHDFYLAQRPDRDAMNAAYEKYHTDHKEILEKMSKHQRGSEEFKALEATPEYKAFAQAEHDFFTMVETSIANAIKNNSDNWMGPFAMLTNYSYLTTDANRPQYEAFTEEVKNSFYGKIVAEKVIPMATDKPMPDFTFTDHATGKKMSIYEICKQNKYVLIDFWASWCKPCRKEIPNFKAQYELYKDKGFQVVSISADAKEADWLKALAEENLAWPNDRDGDQGICNLYKVQFYPTVYLLDKDAKVIVSNDDARGEKLQQKLAELFK